MHRLLALRAASSWSKLRAPQTLFHVRPTPRALPCCGRSLDSAVLCRPLLTSAPLYRHRRTKDEREEDDEEEEEEGERIEEDGEDEDDEADTDRGPRLYRSPSSPDSATLPLKYLLRSDFFATLLLTAHPTLTPLQYRTHLSSFIQRHASDRHLRHLVARLVAGEERAGEGGGGGRRRRKRARRDGRVRLAREIATIYAEFVRDETGELHGMDGRKVKGGRRKAAARAVEETKEQDEDDEEEEEEEEENNVEDGEEEVWHDGALWSTAKDGDGRSGQPKSHAKRSRARDEFIEEDESDESNQQQRRQQRRQQHQHDTSTASTLLRGRNGRLRYDPSLAFLADLSQPHETFPLARSLNRKIILHTGPTNSGKTHAAMQALQAASTGIYAAPLRLLAWEQYDRLTKRGVKAELVTGQELLTSDDATHTSSTIEMISVERLVDVAVVDEVQMIGSEDRGGAWTRAVLGVAARTVHVCGDVSVVGLMEDLCSVMGEELQVISYSRLTPLNVSPPLQSLSNLRRGDCVIAFARSELYALKRQIESQTRLRCALIYGSLPPTLRRQQAEQFNTPDGPWDVLVATDAIGMGLNLNIGRIIFSSLVKFDGKQERMLTVRETLQIAGRAGRFAGAFAVGYVTTLTRDSYGKLKRLMKSELEPLTLAGLGVSLVQLESLALHRPREPLHTLLRYMEQFAALDDLYFLADLSQWIAVAHLLRSFPTLTLSERYVFCLAPISVDKLPERATLLSFLHQYTAPSLVEPPTVSWRPLADWRRLSALGSTAGDLLQLEAAWKDLDVYVWLSRRLGEERFTERAEAEEMRERVSEQIAAALSGMSDAELRKRRTARKHERLLANRGRQAGQQQQPRMAASVQWTDVDDSGDEVAVRGAAIDVVEAEAEAKSASTLSASK